MTVLKSSVNGGPVLLHFTANATCNIAGAGANSDISNPATEVVVGATISKIAFSTTGTITIKRGSTTAFVLTGTYVFDLRALNMIYTKDWDQTLVVTFSDTASFVMIELSKNKIAT